MIKKNVNAKKNIKIVAGKHLIVWTIEAALKSSMLSRVVLSTDDKIIAEIGKNMKKILKVGSLKLAIYRKKIFYYIYWVDSKQLDYFIRILILLKKNFPIIT